MKSILTALLCLALYPATTQASKARMEALGQATSGSHYLMDSRSMFRNPSSLMDLNNQAMFEWGGAAVDNKPDTNAEPRAEGGFIMDHGDMKVGLYLGGESDTGLTLRNSASEILTAMTGTITNDFMTSDNAFELFFAGKSGMGNWGASFFYSANTMETSATAKAEESSMGARLGMTAKGWDAYLLLGLGNTASGTVNKAGSTASATSEGAEFKGKLGFELGGSADVMGGKVFASYKSTEADIEASPSLEGNVKGGGYTLGWANKKDTTAGFWFYSAAVTNETTEGTSGTTTASETANMTLPVTIGFEANAKSWLALRGSVMQSVLINDNKDEVASTTSSNQDTTAVAAGASLKFDAVSLDATLGSAGTTAGAGLLDSTNLFSRVAFNYTF